MDWAAVEKGGGAMSTLSRERVEQLCERIRKEITWKHEIGYILDTDAALRDQVARLTAERDEYKRKYDLVSNDADYRQCCQLRDQAEVALTEVKASYADARAKLKAVERKYHEAMDIMCAWKNIDHADAVAQLLSTKQQLAAVTKERDEAQNKLSVYQTVYGGEP